MNNTDVDLDLSRDTSARAVEEYLDKIKEANSKFRVKKPHNVGQMELQVAARRKANKVARKSRRVNRKK